MGDDANDANKLHERMSVFPLFFSSATASSTTNIQHKSDDDKQTDEMPENIPRIFS